MNMRVLDLALWTLGEVFDGWEETVSRFPTGRVKRHRLVAITRAIINHDRIITDDPRGSLFPLF